MTEFIAAQIRIDECGAALKGAACPVSCMQQLKAANSDFGDVIAASSPGQQRLLLLAPPVDQLRPFKYRSSSLLHHTDYNLARFIYTAHRSPR
jgi:hypothetical protein